MTWIGQEEHSASKQYSTIKTDQLEIILTTRLTDF